MNEMFIANRCIFNRSKFYQGAQVSKLQVYNKKKLNEIVSVLVAMH